MVEQMKPSGIDWIGDIPQSWDIKRLKYLLEQSAENMKVGPFGSALSGGDIVNEGKWVYNQRVVLDDKFNETDSFITEEKFQEMKGFVVKGGDLLITTRGTIGKVAIVPDNPPEGILHPCIIKFRVNKKLILPELVKLIFNESDLIKDQFVLMSNATTIEVIYSYSLKEIILPVIPMEEQKAIADFLDKQCLKLDGIISDLEKQIETLQKYKKSLILETVTKGLNKNVPMKSSGIDWIGDIPAHWDIKPLKYLFDLFAGGDIEEYNVSEEKTENYKYPIYSNSLENDGLFGYTNKYRFSGHTITVTGRGEVGHALPRYDSYYPIVRLLVGVPKYSINVEYYADCINSTNILGEQTAMAQLTTQKLGVIKVPVPSFEEQEEIGNFLREKNNNINSIIKTKQEQLEKIKQHKKSLIYEYVTGKKRVKEAINGN